MKSPFLLLICFAFISYVGAQRTDHYNLAQLLTENKLDTAKKETQILNDNNHKQAISIKGTVWLKNVSFTKGTIDVDLRGKNVFFAKLSGHCISWR